MIKLIIMDKRKAGTSHEDYVRHHTEHHAQLFTSQPEVRQYVRRYVHNHPTTDKIAGRSPMSDFDGVTEFWFDDMDGLNGVFESDNYKNNVVPDEEAFLDRDNSQMMIVEETVVIE